MTSSNPKIKIARSSDFYLHQVEDDLEINLSTSFCGPIPRLGKHGNWWWWWQVSSPTAFSVLKIQDFEFLNFHLCYSTQYSISFQLATKGVFTWDRDELRPVRACMYQYEIFAAIYMRPGRNAWSITWDQYELKDSRSWSYITFIIRLFNML